MIQITHWRSCRDPLGTRHRTTFSGLFERFRTPIVARDKSQLPGWAPATFARNYRSLANFEALYAIGLDIEKGATRFEDACTLFSEFWCFLHTTFSHTPEAHRLRVIVPTSRPITIESECRRVRKWLAVQSNRAGQLCDPQASDPSRLWFVPGVAPGCEYLCHESTGAILDVDAVLDLQPEEPDALPLADVIPIGRSTNVVDRARRYLAACPGAISGNGGHTTTFLIAQKLVRGLCLDEDTAYSLLTEWNQRCEPPWTEKDLRRKVRQAARGRFPVGALLDARRNSHGA